jgi:UDP-N-acetylglucosamine 2-epimerase (non-hydrolysing)
MANMIIGLEKTFVEHKPDLLIVVGDVNSTVAAALTADRMKIKVAHVESGLRSYDRSMPEEINRIITDEIADYYFVTEQSGIDNLVKEGKPRENIFFVGNTMIDTLMAFKGKIDSSDILRTLGLKSKDFVLITMHRPAVVDSEEGLIKLIELINEVTKKYKVVFPLHPRTIKTIAQFNLKGKISENKNLIITEPLDYFSFQKLIKDCKFIITDSGGIQEESTFLGIPCLTLRPNTERPSTISIGTNELVPFNISELKRKIAEIETGQYKKGRIPPLWDGKATERIIDTLIRLIH